MDTQSTTPSQTHRLMAWLPLTPNSESETKILHLKETPGAPWQPYTRSAHRVADYKISGGSAGYSTMQALMKKGWKLISSQVAEADRCMLLPEPEQQAS